MRAARAITIAILFHAALLGGYAARAAAGQPAAAGAADPLEAALAELRGADLVVIDPAAPGRPQSAFVALRVHAAPAAVQAILLDPRVYRDAIPSLIRAEVVARRQRPDAVVPDQQLEWELEIPLFNLEGTAWLSPRPDGAQLILSTGDLAPGKLVFTCVAAASPDPGGAAAGADTVLTLTSQVNVRAAGWLFRHIVSRSPFGESAMNATAAWVVLRAIAALAEHPGDARARRPQAAPAPPPLQSLDGRALAGAALAPFRAKGGILAAIRRAPSGRLSSVATAVPLALAPPALAARLAAPESWRAFPGWHEIKPLVGGRVEVRDDLPFVDFDAVWEPRRAPPLPLRVTATGGATRGALFGWDVVGAPAPAGGGTAGGSLAILSIYPRLEASGYIPRRFVAAEPLLEHGMALALAYADAMSMKASLENGAGQNQKQ